MTFLVTFHTHFDANVFRKKAKTFGSARMRPVPRKLSSSCGTCVEFSLKSGTSLSAVPESDSDSASEAVSVDGSCSASCAEQKAQNTGEQAVRTADELLTMEYESFYLVTEEGFKLLSHKE